ncbi:M20 family metallopeptidase [Myxococcota bacterium]|nr:M20 family metallopeptidase [Myxococcota bacterium]
MDAKTTQDLVERVWTESIVPTISEYITIPNVSPMFEPEWRENGHMDRAVALAVDWVKKQDVKGLEIEVLRLDDRTPLVFIEIPGQKRGDVEDTVLYYGHLDKQPPMLPWAEGLDPFKPVIRDGRLYGRGGADDGYAIFASVLSVKALQEQNLPHARIVIVVECCEESGSFDLPAYMDALADRIGTPSLVVCLDSGCATYDQLWCTTSLRGLVAGDLTVELLKEGIHSGEGSGMVASSFRVMRQLLSRLEDEKTGQILPATFHSEIPADRVRQARDTAEELGDEITSSLPLHDGVRTVSSDKAELLLNRTWRPALSITGAAGLPPLAVAGNVLRPLTAVKISLRIPPRVNAPQAQAELKRILEKDPPYGAKVRFSGEKASGGWNALPFSQWLENAMDAASRTYFGKPARYMGEGGSIPFMDMLGKRFPKAQFMITGVLGPHSNAHGPNEFLDLDVAKKVTSVVAHVVAEHYKRKD